MRRFGKLIAVSFFNSNHVGRAIWMCLCDCGFYMFVVGANLRNGNTMSCGCSKGGNNRNPPADIDPDTGRHLCSKCHTKPIKPCDERRRPNAGVCNKCHRKLSICCRRRRWENGERPLCRNHPLTIVTKSHWIQRGIMLCSSCYNNRNERASSRHKLRCKKYYYIKAITPEYREYKLAYNRSRSKTLKLRNYGN